MATRMHADEIPVDAQLVRRLVLEQFPHWAHLPVSPAATGTVNAMFRLGDAMVVRLPFVPDSTGIDFEAEWLPKLASGLDVSIPSVLGLGEPTSAYPLRWLVLDWLGGEPVVPGALVHADGLASDLAAFITGLRRIDPTGAPAGYRCGPLHPLDRDVRDCLPQIGDLVDVATLLPVWDRALAARPWEGTPTWAHCDLLTGNVRVSGGQLSGILDFATAGVGDPACDLMAAWSMLPEDSRKMFRTRLDVGDDEWARGRGWALSQAAIALPYYRDTFPAMATTSLHILRQLGGEERRGGSSWPTPSCGSIITTNSVKTSCWVHPNPLNFHPAVRSMRPSQATLASIWSPLFSSDSQTLIATPLVAVFNLPFAWLDIEQSSM
jgi:aminoglycoside phosphotransferase (APT) family kinase protein